jgi:hypothetical protein
MALSRRAEWRARFTVTGAEENMRSIHGLIVAAATLLVISACSAAADAHKAFSMDKTCVRGPADQPICTIVSSSIEAIPPGTVINYTDVGDGSTIQKNAVFMVANGSASGFCDFNHDGKPLAAQCTFLSGTGVLTGFHLVADVTVTDAPNAVDSVWHWNGTYWFGD